MLDRGASYLLFVQWAAAGKPLDDPAVVIAAGKAHSLVNAGRILAQDMLYHTLALHEFLPVQHGQIAQTKNAMLHRDFVSRLLPGIVRNHRVVQLPVALRWTNTDRHAAEKFDEAQPQHAANRPQFRQIQRCHGLVGAEELVETLLVELGVAMSDQFPRHKVDSGDAFTGVVAKAAATRGGTPCGDPVGPIASTLESG